MQHLKLYNRYLIRKITSYFLVVISALIALIWFAKAISFIRFVTEKGVSISDFLNLFVLILPALLIIIIPVALFVGVLFAYNQMLAHNEIVIWRNAGLDKLTLAKPAILLSSICCVICFLISFFLMPHANKKLRTMRLDLQQNYANLLISPGIFENLNSLTIYVKNRDYNNQLSGILIYDSRNPEYSTTITSETGTINQDDDSMLLYLNNGTVQRFNYQTKKSDILNFDSYVVNLSDNNQQNLILRWKASERYIGELINPDDSTTSRELGEYYVELQQRITYPFFSLVLTLIASAFILSGKFSRYGNVVHNIKAVCCAVSFMGLMMFGYGIIRNSPQLTILLYLILLFFITVSCWMLKNHKQILKNKF